MVLQRFLDDASEWSHTVASIVAAFEQILFGALRELEPDTVLDQSIAKLSDLQIEDSGDVVLGQCTEYDSLVDTIQQLWPSQLCSLWRSPVSAQRFRSGTHCVTTHRRLK